MNADCVHRVVGRLAAGLACLLLAAGCSSPSIANIQVRKENHKLRDEVEFLKRQHEADAATIRALASRSTTAPILPNEQIEKLFTAHGLRIGRLTGPGDIDPNKPGEEGLKVYVCPIDDAGQPLKAAGSFVVETFDLDKPGDTRIGHWEFPLDRARQNWFGQAMLYTYVLPCPWQTPPAHSKLTLKIKFTDALTHRTFDEQKVINVPPKGP